MTAVRTASSDSLAGPGNRRYQPYLSSLNTDRRTWGVPAYAASGAATASGLSLESPLSAGDSPAIPSQMTPVAYTAGGQQPTGYETASFYSAVPRGAAAYPPSGAVEYASQPRALTNYIPSTSYGASSPQAQPATYPPSANYPRRHTVSGFQQAAAGFPTAQAELEDVLVKEEKRRRVSGRAPVSVGKTAHPSMLRVRRTRSRASVSETAHESANARSRNAWNTSKDASKTSKFSSSPRVPVSRAASLLR